MEIDKQGVAVNLPDFILVGAAKSATTSLYYYLRQCEKIYLPEIKEPWFFSFRNNAPKLAQLNYPDGINVRGVHVFDEREYFSLFEQAKPGQIIGEASTSYLYLAETSIANMKEVYGKAHEHVKIIMILRNPVERAWSHYMMHVRDGIAEYDFLKAITNKVLEERIQKGWTIAYDYIGQGMYSKRVESYLRAFKNVKVILFDEIEVAPGKVTQETLAFLGVGTDGLQLDTSTRYNKSGVAKAGVKGVVAKLLYTDNPFKRAIKWMVPKPMRIRVKHSLSSSLLEGKAMPDAVRLKLLQIYREDIDKLEQLIERDLSSWK